MSLKLTRVAARTHASAMRPRRCRWLALLVLACLLGVSSCEPRTIAVRLSDGADAGEFAASEGLVVRHWVTPDVVLFEAPYGPVHAHGAFNTTRLARSTAVLWSAAQTPLQRAKRNVGIHVIGQQDEESIKQPPINVEHVDEQQQRQRGMSINDQQIDTPLSLDDQHRDVSKRQSSFNDPLYAAQWHVNPSTSSNHVNAAAVWSSGNAGKGVVVAVVDDGLDHTHLDLKPNYFADASYDFNENDRNPMPTGRADVHGTRCAGEVAAAADNGVCGVGVAYEASIAGLRILSGDVTDAMEAAALSYRSDLVHVYSSSWGPFDNGATVEGPGDLARGVLADGVRFGRGGRGSVFVFASGNGGANDDCNYDGYTNSIFTIAIGAADYARGVPFYQEWCAAQLAVTYSSNAQHYISTSDVHGACTSKMGGTSAAAPIAAGVLALVLAARPTLTWRDMQWLVVTTAVPTTDVDSEEAWPTNAAGLRFNPLRGFGLIDARKMVDAAAAWTPIGPHARANFPAVLVNAAIPYVEQSPNGLVSRVNVSAPSIKRLEHVQVTVTVVHAARGDLAYEVTCPSGTRVMLARPRAKDTSSAGLAAWTFMTVACWGEAPSGEYVLRVRDMLQEDMTGKLVQWSVTLNGEAAEIRDDPPTRPPGMTPTPTVSAAPTTTPSPTVTSSPTSSPTPTSTYATPTPAASTPHTTVPTEGAVVGDRYMLAVAGTLLLGVGAMIVYRMVRRRAQQQRVRVVNYDEAMFALVDDDESL